MLIRLYKSTDLKYEALYVAGVIAFWVVPVAEMRRILEIVLAFLLVLLWLGDGHSF